MPNHSLNYPASAMLKPAAADYKPTTPEYTSYDNSAAESLLEHIESNIGIRRDAQDAHKREWQLRCTSEYNHTQNEKLRVLVVNGAMTMFALTKTIVQTFGLTELTNRTLLNHRRVHYHLDHIGNYSICPPQRTLGQH